MTVPDGVVAVTCSADVPPRDHWRSIVDSMHILVATPAPAPAFDARVELPAHGLAVEFPSEWLVETWPDSRGLVLGGHFVLRAVLPSLALESAEPRITSLQSTDDWRQVFSEANDGRWARNTPMDPGRHPIEPSVIAVDLPAGPGIRADWVDWGGAPATAWVFREGDRAAVLFCRAAEPPADAWRSIAETFEYLSTEE